MNSNEGPRPEAKRERLPRRLGRYDVRAKIGEGGMATVYVGHDGEHAVALKVIKEAYSLNRDFVDMFLDEANIVSALKHPNLIDVIELGTEGARLFIAMDLLQGKSLWYVWMACRDRGVRLRYDAAAWIGARVAEGLHHAHELKDDRGRPLDLVHRDVNASNVYLTYDGQVKVIDFGLAKAANRVSRTAAGVVKGKFAYMSPEQAVGKPIDRRTDVFALAATLWELTVDRRLFKGKDDFETLRRVTEGRVKDPTTLVDGYPRDLRDILLKALDRDRTKRYATALELSHALDGFVARSGRSWDAAAIAEMMGELFPAERERERAWLSAARAADRPAPQESLRPRAPITPSIPPAMPSATVGTSLSPPSPFAEGASEGPALARVQASDLTDPTRLPRLPTLAVSPSLQALAGGGALPAVGSRLSLFAPAAVRLTEPAAAPSLPPPPPPIEKPHLMGRYLALGAFLVVILALAVMVGALLGARGH